MYRIVAVGIKKAKRLADQYTRFAIAKIRPASVNGDADAQLHSGMRRAALKATGTKILNGSGAYAIMIEQS